MEDSHVVRWVIAIVASLGIVALLAWDRNDPGVGGRVPDKDTAVVILVGKPAGP
jgi:hypothetical protein